MNLDEGRRFLTSLEEVVKDADLEGLVEYERALGGRRGVTVEPDAEDPAAEEDLEDLPLPEDDEDILLYRIAVLLDLVEAALEMRHDIRQEVIAMGEQLAADGIVADARVRFAWPAEPRNGDVEEIPEGLDADDVVGERSQVQQAVRPHGENFAPFWEMRQQLGMKRERVHPVVIPTRPKDWSQSWRRRKNG